MKALRGMVMLVAMCLALSTCTTLAKSAGKYEAWDDSCGTIERNVAYDSGKRNDYDLYLPAGKARNGIIVCIHGGSWMGGSKDDLDYVCKRYCKAGYVAASIDYSVIAFLGHNDVTLPQMDAEIHAAIGHIRQRLEARGVHINNMALWGYSAGSQLAMAYAMKHRSDAPYPVRFVVDQVGPSDLTAMFPANEEKLRNIEQRLAAGENLANNGDKKDVDNLVFRASGARMKAGMYNRATVEKLIGSSSPAQLVKRGDAPTIMTYGEKDIIVKPTVRKAVVDAFEKQHVPYTLILFPNSGHDLASDPDCTAKLRATVDDYLKQYFQ